MLLLCVAEPKQAVKVIGMERILNDGVSIEVTFQVDT